ncbi:uncharacterized protein CXorf38 homolog [Nerophis ophidion]|uniref:uncharacterized protein CXorf38 homolog n=1 Tax=Nerophis ophidion TaxID=159077 RepID=UPI002AE0B06D|nr:uncharacterized protein CXorf38 homolog [Nerophis ophidion]
MSLDFVLRVNNKDYQNWVKAGLCLSFVAEDLRPFVEEQMRDFHRDLLRGNPGLQERCEKSCPPNHVQFSKACRPCLEWKSEILKNHRQRDPKLKWGNCNPPAWRTDYWELAKAYMPQGQLRMRAANEFDASALLNLVNYCDRFPPVDVNTGPVKEMIRCRNDLMHSAKLLVTDAWMKNFKDVMARFFELFRHVPSMAQTEEKIHEALAYNISSHLLGAIVFECSSTDTVVTDGLEKGSGSLFSLENIRQREADLLQERVWEMRHRAEEDEIDTEQLTTLEHFLQTHNTPMSMPGLFTAFQLKT